MTATADAEAAANELMPLADQCLNPGSCNGFPVEQQTGPDRRYHKPSTRSLSLRRNKVQPVGTWHPGVR